MSEGFIFVVCMALLVMSVGAIVMDIQRRNIPLQAKAPINPPIDKLRTWRKQLVELPQYSLIAQANLERNADDISKERQKELTEFIYGNFSTLQLELPTLTPDDLRLCVLSYAGLNKEVISLLLKASDEALRQRRSRLKKKIPRDFYDEFMGK